MPASSTQRAPDPSPRLSVAGRQWSIAVPDDGVVRAIGAAGGLSDLAARLLALRGIAPADVADYLAPTLRRYFPDPSGFKDMDRAAGLVLEAILSGKRVTVFADYDVDGGTSAAILTRYFRAWGRPLGLYVPDRLEEGYGPSPQAFRKLKAGGSDLVITVDCGASATAALAEAAAIGLDVIVIDHHLMPGAVPDTLALVNPNRPDCRSGQGHLAAAGVVFVFAAALNRLARSEGVTPPAGLPDLMELLDLAALGTLCDMAPLRDFNRALVRQGLQVLARGGNAGLKALADVAGIARAETAYHAAFLLGPRLNAGGRVGDPWIAAKLLATDCRDEAIALAERLNQLNAERKAVEAAILEQATAEALRTLERDPTCPILVAAGEGWHPGVIGIVAGRLKERFHLPAIVIGWGEGLGPLAKGSGRSVAGINLGKLISDAAKDGVILSGGGHEMAAGLSCEPHQVDGLRRWLAGRVSASGDLVAAARTLFIDAVVAPGALLPVLADEIASLGPFGAGSPEPVFLMPQVHVQPARPIGADHLRFAAGDATGRSECVAWRCASQPLGEMLRQGGLLDLAGRVRVDNWNGGRRVQFEVIDARPADRVPG